MQCLETTCGRLSTNSSLFKGWMFKTVFWLSWYHGCTITLRLFRYYSTKSLVCEFYMSRITHINTKLQGTTRDCQQWLAMVSFAFHTYILIKITNTETEKSITYLSKDAINEGITKWIQKLQWHSVRELQIEHWSIMMAWHSNRIRGAKIIAFDWWVLESVTITLGGKDAGRVFTGITFISY